MKNLVDYYETADDVAVKDFLYEYSIEGMDIQKIEQPKLVKSEFYKKKDQKIFASLDDKGLIREIFQDSDKFKHMCMEKLPFYIKMV